jgi:hypothetical protein
VKILNAQVLPISPTKPQRGPDRRQPEEPTDGIDVREEQLGSVTAQPIYRLCCDCGRAWFELELPAVVRCPECAKLGVVSL